jgi:hypothetical protein
VVVEGRWLGQKLLRHRFLDLGGVMCWMVGYCEYIHVLLLYWFLQYALLPELPLLSDVCRSCDAGR